MTSQVNPEDREPTLLECLASITVHLARIADAIEFAVRYNAKEDITPVASSDSIGTCPNCDSISVQQSGALPNAIFKCGQCNFTWISSEDERFNSR